MSEPGAVSGHVFISYVHEDSSHVGQLQRALESAGCRVWRDSADLWPGQDWRAEIRRAITEDAFVFVACFSHQSRALIRSYQNEELVLAIEEFRRRPAGTTWLIPVRFDDCEIPDLDLGGGRTLPTIQHADLFGDNAVDATARLVAAVLRVLETDRAALGAALNARDRPFAGVDLAELESCFVHAKAVGSPGGLLGGQAALADFVGRDEEIARLENWRDQKPASQADVKIFLVTGKGGEGKTRLAVEFAERSREAGWFGGTLRPNLTQDHARVLAHCLRPLMLVIDYAAAEAAETEMLIRALLSARRESPVRLVLLAREAGRWWDDLAADLEEDMPIQSADVLRLPPLVTGTSALAPKALFADAAQSLAPHLARFTDKTATEMLEVAARIRVPLWLDHDVSHVLTIQMGALVALLDECSPADGHGFDDGVTGALLRHEKKYRDKLAKGFELDDLRLVRDRALSGAVLFGARGPLLADARQAACAVVKAALAPDLDATVARQRQVAAWIAGIYPPDAPLPGEDTEYWGEVVPDMLAESLTIELLAGEVPAEYGQQSDAALAGLLESLAAHADASGAARALLLLSRAAEREPRAASWIDRLVRSYPDLLGCVAVQVAAYAENPEPLRRALVDLGLSEAGVLRSALAPLHDAFSRFSLRRLYTVVAVTWEFVLLYGELAGRRPDIWLQDSAGALGSYASALQQIGRRVEAIPFSASAVDLRRELAGAGHDGQPGLAAALTNHAQLLSEAGHVSESVPVSLEAVEMYRQLARHNHDFRLGLAGALANHAASLWRVGNLEEAVRASEKALTLRRKLAELDWVAYLPDLTRSLINHAAILAAAGYHAQAMTAATTGVDLAHDMSEHDRDAHLPELAVSLMNLAGRLADSGHGPDSAQIAAEAVLACQQLTEHSYDAYLPELAASQTILASALGRCGRHGEAVENSQVAVDLYRELATLNRTAYLPDLSNALGAHALRLAEAGQDADALEASQEAIDLNRVLVSDSREVYLNDLATALTNRVAMLAEIGRYGDAMPISLEAIALDRELVSRNRRAALPTLATALSNHAAMLEETSSSAMALPFSKEAANSWLEVTEHRGEEYLADCVTSLSNLGHLLFELHQIDEACAACMTAAHLGRKLPEDQSSAMELATYTLRMMLEKYPELGQRLYKPAKRRRVPKWLS